MVTGLYNRRFYEQYFSQKEIQLILPMAFVMGDVNGLKITNDVFGHTIGDQLLTDIAKTLKVAAGSRHQVIRWGGDEFMIVMPGSDLKDAEVLVKRIKVQLQDICINGTINALLAALDENKAETKAHTQRLSDHIMKLADLLSLNVDAYDVMTYDQVYRPDCSHEETIRELQAQAGTQFDPRLVERFINLVSHW